MEPIYYKEIIDLEQIALDLINDTPGNALNQYNKRRTVII